MAPEREKYRQNALWQINKRLDLPKRLHVGVVTARKQAGNGRRKESGRILKAAVLSKKKNAVWNEGFLAGQVLNSECPHPVGSPGAKEWLEGWAVGIRKRGKANEKPGRNPGRGWAAIFWKSIGR